MEKSKSVVLFEEKYVRRIWDEKAEKWYFSIIDAVSILTDSDNPRRYWSDLKRKLADEGSQLYEKIVQLKMIAEDGKMRLTDVADAEQLLRVIQSIPSPKAEPFKLLSRYRNNVFYADKYIMPTIKRSRYTSIAMGGLSTC